MNKLQFFEVAQLLHQVQAYYNRHYTDKKYDRTNATAFVVYYSFFKLAHRFTEATLDMCRVNGISYDLTRSDLLQLVEEEWVDDTLERLNAMKAAYKNHYEKTEPI